jgi:hypothetical protein
MWLTIVIALIDTRFTQFELSGDGAIVVPVLVQGQGPFRFLLDTGTRQSVISETLARPFGTAAGQQTVMLTPVGERSSRPMTWLSRLDLGAFHSTGVLMAVVEDDVLVSRQRVYGVVGQCVPAHLQRTVRTEARVEALDAGRSPRLSTSRPAGCAVSPAHAGTRGFAAVLPMGARWRLPFSAMDAGAFAPSTSPVAAKRRSSPHCRRTCMSATPSGHPTGCDALRARGAARKQLDDVGSLTGIPARVHPPVRCRSSALW